MITVISSRSYKYLYDRNRRIVMPLMPLMPLGPGSVPALSNCVLNLKDLRMPKDGKVGQH